MDKRTAKSTAEIRRAFLDYFQARGHTVVPSSPLVPIHDPTLLFTNAGMVQFKEVFVGREQRPYKRAASCQACVRAGGKHNDLENVGYTARHHTFFEMLGNFSFGDYFKREAICYAWEFLTEILEIPKERLWVTVFHEDHEAETLWLEEIGIDPARFSRCGEESNFWAMGTTGPCGPSTEIFYDHGPAIAGGPPGSPEQHGDRYVEIWNLVFTQYDRDDEGRLHRLPKPSVDTGMGLERIAAVMQGVHSNYAIDLFQVLTAAICTMLGRAPEARDKASLDVIADHIRSCAFIAAEGVVPSNEGRGYVLRRIIRRAIRHGHKLGIEGPFFYRLVEALGQAMGSAYSQFLDVKSTVAGVLRQEEERFAETLEQGLKLLDRSLAELRGTVIPGKDIFQLYDTYGFPVELTADIARERELTLDMEGFEREMTAQRERAR
ncbi:MAG TPA: alanine--tRNA ligase, partial [Gammaproteobacteria bacterium]|nr:alanine--tRNA ligase [Gammaproteobacteria bacterium]